RWGSRAQRAAGRIPPGPDRRPSRSRDPTMPAPTIHSHRPRAEDFRGLARLAVPVVFVQIGLMAMNVVDTMILGRVSAVALAGAAIGSGSVFIFSALGTGTVMVLGPSVCHAVAATHAAPITPDPPPRLVRA